RLVGADQLQRAVADGNGRDTGRAPQRLLRARVAVVDAPGFGFDLLAGERGDAVDVEQRFGTGGAHRLGELLHRELRPGRRLCVHDADDLGVWVRPQRFDDAIDGHNLPEIGRQLDDLGADPVREVVQPGTEEAPVATDHLVARLEQVENTRLHRRVPRRGQADG